VLHAVPIWLYNIVVSLTSIIGDFMILFSVTFRSMFFCDILNWVVVKPDWVFHGPRPNIMSSN
jgi:hypothetical protein